MLYAVPWQTPNDRERHQRSLRDVYWWRSRLYLHSRSFRTGVSSVILIILIIFSRNGYRSNQRKKNTQLIRSNGQVSNETSITTATSKFNFSFFQIQINSGSTTWEIRRQRRPSRKYFLSQKMWRNNLAQITSTRLPNFQRYVKRKIHFIQIISRLNKPRSRSPSKRLRNGLKLKTTSAKASTFQITHSPQCH